MDNILDYIFNSFLDRKEDKITNKIFHNKTKSKKYHNKTKSKKYHNKTKSKKQKKSLTIHTKKK
jgi:predicted transcriptional regulator YheO